MTIDKPHIHIIAVFLTLLGISTVHVRAERRQFVYPDDFPNKASWSSHLHKTDTFAQTLYVVGRLTDNNKLLLAPTRVRQPEEFVKGLPTDSSEYKIAEQENSYNNFLVLEGTFDSHNIRLGQTIKNLAVQVLGTRYLYSSNTLTFSGNERCKPSVPGRLKICAINVENFYIEPSDNYGGPSTREECLTQATKITKALSYIDADIYALAEVEQRTAALDTLVNRLNALSKSNKFVKLESDIWNTATTYNRVCFIYNKNKIKAVTNTYSPYATNDYKHRILFALFEEVSTKERFVLSMNHFRSKRTGTEAETNEVRMANAQQLIDRFERNMPSAVKDSDILLVGDFNNYTMEAPNQYILSHGYVDETMRFSPNGYSYVYAYQVGYLDHVFANTTMHTQVKGVVPIHMNADEPESLEYTSGDKSMYRFSDHDPLLIGITLGDTTSAALSVEDDNLQIIARNNAIHIATNMPSNIKIYSALGYLIADKDIQSQTDITHLSKGIYIVYCNHKSYKVILL